MAPTVPNRPVSSALPVIADFAISLNIIPSEIALTLAFSFIVSNSSLALSIKSFFLVLSAKIKSRLACACSFNVVDEFNSWEVNNPEAVICPDEDCACFLEICSIAKVYFSATSAETLSIPPALITSPIIEAFSIPIAEAMA